MLGLVFLSLARPPPSLSLGLCPGESSQGQLSAEDLEHHAPHAAVEMLCAECAALQAQLQDLTQRILARPKGGGGGGTWFCPGGRVS